MITGVCSTASSTPKPSSSGICTSRKASSGLWASMASTAANPSPHSPMISTSGSPTSISTILSRASGSSSTINALILSISFILLLHPKRNSQADDQSALVPVAKIEEVVGAVKLLQPRAGVGQSDALFDLRAPGVRQTRAVVAYLKLEFILFEPGRNLDQPRRGMWRDAVTDGVFDQRLQNQIRHARVERLRLDIHLHLQPVAESRLFNLQVAFEKFQLLPQRSHLRSDVLQSQSQQVAQPRDHPLGGFHVAAHQRRDGVQRVEEEMWMQLHFQRLQLRRLQFVRAVFPIVVESVNRAQDRVVGEECRGELHKVALPRVEPLQESRRDHYLEDRKEKA